MNPSNCMTFKENWQVYSNHILAALALDEKEDDFFTCFSTDIEPMLALSKLLTPKPKGRLGRNPNWFQDVVNDFITYLPVS